MGKVKELVSEAPHVAEDLTEYLTGGGCVVLFRHNDGWFTWTTARWWDDPLHAHYREGKMEVERFDDLIDALAARDAFNAMMHGTTTQPNY